MTCYDLNASLSAPIPLPEKPLIVALGNFDGVHIGHQSLLRRVCALRGAFPGAESAVWTFDPHPRFSVDSQARCLSSTEERLAAFAAAGIDLAILENFSSVRNLSPESFVQEILRDSLHCCAVVCGFNFHFGQGGRGDAALLVALASQEGMLCETLPAVTEGGAPVSSTRIRASLERGEVDTAARLLGRPYALSGKVIYGRQIGRTLSLPTVNQPLPSHLVIPAAGVYATDVILPDRRVFRGVTNIGAQPTFGSDTYCMETHLIDFDGDLYGSTIRVSFLQRLRDIRRFDSPEALRDTIRADINTARRLGATESV